MYKLKSMQIKISNLLLDDRAIDFSFVCIYYTNKIIEIHSKSLLTVYKWHGSPLKERIFSEVFIHLQNELSILFSRRIKWQGMSSKIFIEDDVLEISLEFEL